MISPTSGQPKPKLLSGIESYRFMHDPEGVEVQFISQERGDFSNTFYLSDYSSEIDMMNAAYDWIDNIRINHRE